MLYYANVSTPKACDAMRAGALGQIVSPAEGRAPLAGVSWVADNSVFGGAYPGDDRYLGWLRSLPFRTHCRFATAPDVVGDAQATLARSVPMLRRIRHMVPVAFIAQDGVLSTTVPWRRFDALFIGGTTEFKLGAEARAVAAEGRARRKWVHMGRVNSLVRLTYAASIGCHSVDGTYLTFGPDVNLPRLLGWIDRVNRAYRLRGDRLTFVENRNGGKS